MVFELLIGRGLLSRGPAAHVLRQSSLAELHVHDLQNGPRLSREFAQLRMQACPLPGQHRTG